MKPLLEQDTFSKASYRGDGGCGKDFGILGCGEGNIFAYLRRSCEDRSSRPLHVQKEVIARYVAERMPSHRNVSKTARRIENPDGDEFIHLSKKRKKCNQVGPSCGGEVNEYFVDNGVSAALSIEQRPGLSKMFERLEEACSLGDEAHMVVYDVSRLARSDIVGNECRRRLEKMGVHLHLAQSRIRVEGNVEEMLFGITLKMAESERTQTISRIKTAFRYKKEWDPRKSFGWELTGKKQPPRPIPEEQVILEEIRSLYENDGLKVCEIASIIQQKHGSRRCRKEKKEEKKSQAETEEKQFETEENKVETEEMQAETEEKQFETEEKQETEEKKVKTEENQVETEEKEKQIETKKTQEKEEEEKNLIPWKGDEISFLAKKNHWTWGGGKTLLDLEKEILEMQENDFSEANLVNEIFQKYQGQYVDGVRVNKPMIRSILLIEDFPVWKRKAILRTVGYLRKKKFSNDDIVHLLNEEAPRLLPKRKKKESKKSSEEESKENRKIEKIEEFLSTSRTREESEESKKTLVLTPWNRKSVWQIIQIAQQYIDREKKFSMDNY